MRKIVPPSDDRPSDRPRGSRAIATRSPDNPDFARVIVPARLRRMAEFGFDLAPTPEEEAALARLLGALSLREMRLQGVLRPAGNGWELEAVLGATVEQPCIVTLEPVRAHIDIPVRRRFLPEAQAPSPAIDMAPLEDDDEIEPLGERIDLGLVAIEALALALPAYPRAKSAALGQDGSEPDEPPERKPFAALAALKDKMGEGG
ncbi:hypothetical protein BH23PSE1_BH23PSE1_00480 [soil metagenome]